MNFTSSISWFSVLYTLTFVSLNFPLNIISFVLYQSCIVRSAQISSPNHREFVVREDKYRQRSNGFGHNMEDGKEISNLMGEQTKKELDGVKSWNENRI